MGSVGNAVRMHQTPKLLIVALAGCAVVAVATFLPWQETALNGEVSGFGSGGWTTLVLALIAAWNLSTWRATGNRRDAYIAGAVGATAMLASAYLLYDFSAQAEGMFEESTISEPMIGTYVALIGSAVLAVASLALARTTPEGAATAAPARAG